MADTLSFGLEKHQIRMNKKNFNNLISVVAGETGRVLEIQLLDNNENVQNTTGISLRLNALVKGKATYIDAVLLDATTGTYRLDLFNGMFLATGTWEFQWQITDSSGKRIYSIVFEGTVGKNIAEGGSQASNFYLNFAELNSMHKEFLNERSLLGDRLDGNDTTLDDHEGRITELENDVVVSATNLFPQKTIEVNTYGYNTNINITLKKNHIYYSRRTFEVLNGTANTVTGRVSVLGSGTNLINGSSVSQTSTHTGGNVTSLVYLYGPNVADANGVFKAKFDNILIIDLTETFGVGNEPTVTQMDRLLTQFLNSWFDGTENLFHAKLALDSMLKNDKALNVTATNLFSNGGMELDSNNDGNVDGMHSLGYYTPTYSIDTTIKMSGNQSQKAVGKPSTRAVMSFNAITNHKYFISGFFRQDTQTVGGSSVISVATGSAMSQSSYKRLSEIPPNQWYRYVYVETATVNQQMSLVVNQLGEDINYWFDNWLAIDLTETFGAGNEPTKEQMDRLLAQFPNSWFEGTQNLFLARWALDELRRLDNEKANKKQEAWITPTLLNGATSKEGYPVGYMKDDMGVVHFRGKLIIPSYGVATISLPVGYRPTTHSDFLCSVERNKVGRILIQTIGTVYPSFPYDANSEYDLSGISFKV